MRSHWSGPFLLALRTYFAWIGQGECVIGLIDEKWQPGTGHCQLKITHPILKIAVLDSVLVMQSSLEIRKDDPKEIANIVGFAVRTWDRAGSV